ncbi:hypothetical protein QUB80_32015 [Chlorogloeopsis sp. ULAP01]|uniref:hypothetical protein n=1 Tax=Chlorogloeopsis sp. ULAP01 TaxID=3056483 RepID=UPI0025AA95E5|nr:hypothetical protein [Chlorogloeopsis sp. ULAP01]MDM9385282.1 hypothetical protein [Chlorogloeopsis sp. ULAP01]
MKPSLITQHLRQSAESGDFTMQQVILFHEKADMDLPHRLRHLPLVRGGWEGLNTNHSKSEMV